MTSPRDAVSLSGGVTTGRLSPFRASHHVICLLLSTQHSHGLNGAAFAVGSWQASDRMSCRGKTEDMGRMMGGGCCCSASLHSSEFFVPALRGQIPQEISDSACSRIKAASFPGFVSDVWILWHWDKVRIFHQLGHWKLYVFVCVYVSVWFLSCLTLAGISTLSSARGSLIPGRLFL